MPVNSGMASSSSQPVREEGEHPFTHQPTCESWEYSNSKDSCGFMTKKGNGKRLPRVKKGGPATGKLTTTTTATTGDEGT